MSEFIHRAKIAELDQTNSELNKEIESLREELEDLKSELEQFREKSPDGIKQLKEIIAEHEERERDFQQRLASLRKEAEHTRNIDGFLEHFFSTLQVIDAGPVAAAIERYYKKKQRPRMIIAFLLGVLAPLAAWLISDFMLDDRAFTTILEQFFANISKLAKG